MVFDAAAACITFALAATWRLREFPQPVTGADALVLLPLLLMSAAWCGAAATTGDSAGGRLVRPRLPAPTAFVGVSNRPASAATNSSKLAFGSISEFGFGAHQVGSMIHSA